jgi:hypothetical protein
MPWKLKREGKTLRGKNLIFKHESICLYDSTTYFSLVAKTVVQNGNRRRKSFHSFFLSLIFLLHRHQLRDENFFIKLTQKLFYHRHCDDGRGTGEIKNKNKNLISLESSVHTRISVVEF